MRFLLAILLLLAAPLAVRAQDQAAPQPAAAAPAAPAVSPADIERVLATLRDDARRAEFVATLEALLRAGGAAPPEPEPTLIPLPPDSLGAQLLIGVSDRIERLSEQAVAAIQAFYDLPGLLAFLDRVWNSPWLRERALEAAWMVALLLGVGAGAEWLVRRALGGLRARLGDAAGRPLGARLLRTLVRFLLDLIPVAAFMATTYAVVLLLSPQLTTRLILLTVNNAWIAVAVAMCAARALLSPGSASLRLIPFGDATAAWLVRSLRRILVVAVLGFVAAEAGLVLGMDQVSYAFIGKLVWLVVSVFLVMLVLQCRRKVCAAIRAPEGARGIWAITRNRVAELWHVVAILYVVAAWLVLAMEIPNGFERMLQVSIATFVILGVAKGLEDALRRGLDSAFAGASAGGDGAAPMAQRVARYVPAGRRIAIVALWAAALLLLFQAWGLEPLSWFKGNALGARLMRALANIGVVVGIALLIWEAANAGIERHLASLSRNAQTAKSARVRTLMPMLRTTLLVAIVLVSALTILSEIGVNVAPLLAGAGVIGIAVGFGSQKLVQDVITGAFLLFEDAIAVGDVVALGGQSGVVEQLSIRSIRLRALDGSIHIIPFSAVTTVTNMTRDYGYAVFDISVSYATDSDRVAQVLRDIGKEMREEDRWAAVIREPLEVMGVEKLAEATVVVRARFKTDPGSRWAVNREFLRRVKQRFDAEGIDTMPSARRVMVEGSPGMSPAARDAAAEAASS